MPPTRFYLPSTGAQPVTTGWGTDWDAAPGVGITGGAVQAKMVRSGSKIGSATTKKDQHTPTGFGAGKVAFSQHISDPIPSAQRIGGTVKGQIMAESNGSGLSVGLSCSLRVISNDGTVLRGIIYLDAHALTGTAIFSHPTTPRNHFVPPPGPSTPNPLAIQAGDRLVIELGYYLASSVSGSLDVWIQYGDDHGTNDLPEDETTTTIADPWIEFSQDLFNPYPEQMVV